MMRLRTLAAVAIACALPAAASAASWFFSTQAKNAGGTVSSRNMTGQRSTAGPIFRSYTTHAPLSVTVTADPGFSIRDVVVNSVSKGSQGSSYATTVRGMTPQSVVATFAPSSLSVTARVSGPGGWVTPASIGNITSGFKLSAPLTFSFVPQNGFYLNTLSGTAGATVSSEIPAPVQKTVTVTYPKGYVFTSPVALSGSFTTSVPTIGVSLPQSGVVGGAVTLYAVPIAGPAPASYTWEQLAGPATVVLNPAGAKMTFTPQLRGYYIFRVTANGGSNGVIAVTVTDSSATSARSQCQFCHQANGIGSAGLYQNWSTSRHRANGIVCEKCHSVHPSYPSGMICLNCHFSGGDTSSHPIAIGGAVCTTCHNPHSLIPFVASGTSGSTSAHFNNVTSAGYPASYLSSGAVCSNCHFGSTANATNRHQWAASKHAAVGDRAFAGRDYKTLSGCVQCHTTTGFIAYSTGAVTAAWGSASDKTKQVVTCIACHSDIATGAVRSVRPVRPYADDGFTNHSFGKSNLCLDCHSGTRNGQSVAAKLAAAPAFGTQPFIDPHYLAAGGTLQSRGGYHFSGQSYASYSSNSHRQIGMGNSNGTGSGGPCVACHKTTDSGHSFAAQAGALCANCHNASLTQAGLDAKKQDYGNALGVLRAQLEAKGFAYYSTATPRFGSANWGSGQAGADTMGAAFNYAFLRSEPGGYAHNAAYSKKLIFDSIDYLYNGTVTGSVESALIGLVANGTITQQAADRVSSYKSAAVGCSSCHNPAASGSHPAHLANGFTCAECHSQTTLNGTVLIPGTVTHLNGRVDVMFQAINSKNLAGSFNLSQHSCSSVTCHGNGAATPVWGSGPVPCESCHTGSLAVINGATAPDRTLCASAGHAKPGIARQCTDCHDPAKQHLGGAGMLKDFLTGGLNAQCQGCHNNSAVVSDPAKSNLSTHFTVSGGSASCSDCHDPHGTSNLYMIKGTILGQSITFADELNGLIDTVTNRGLCQVCHTTTNHYRAGQPETNHFTSGCLGCHTHGNKAGAFKPIGGTCNACHGYPPAPRITAQPVAFGVQGSWSSARFEDYSGGGGAHLVAKHISPNATPSQGWTNCAVCHNGGRTGSAPFHRMVTPVKNHIGNVHIEVDPKYRFDDTFTVYTGASQLSPPAVNATGSCFNIRCHFKPSKRWSIER